jgi:hypothetical protein
MYRACHSPVCAVCSALLLPYSRRRGTQAGISPVSKRYAAFWSFSAGLLADGVSVVSQLSGVEASGRADSE